MTSQHATICLNPQDNVLLALGPIQAGTAIQAFGLTTREDVPRGHKIALKPIAKGQAVYKYGQIIGFAHGDIAAGDHVHVHNLAMGSFDRDYAVASATIPTDVLPAAKQATFEGIVRADGRVATRNYIGILPTVNCAASVAGFIADRFKASDLTRFGNVDGVLALTHGTGCDVGGDGYELLQRTLAGYARNPNFAAILLVGLGCEVNLVDRLLQNTGLVRGPGLESIEIQSAGGTRQSVEKGVAWVQAVLPEADAVCRQSVSADHLVLALECGGSDAFSGLSANPALGAAVDLLVRNGGTAILSETPEIYGAEHLLTRRAHSPAVARKLMQRIQWWEEYTTRLGGEINNNPSPGNKAGGLTNILEKSLGAVAKGGTTNLMAVYEYGQSVAARGLVFMDTPGYDPVSVAGMIAGGATVLAFTTGRGSVSGFKPLPTIKLASNTPLYERMTDDMDFNCGPIVDGTASITEMGRSIFDLILRVASGQETRSEALGFGADEFVPWHRGPVT